MPDRIDKMDKLGRALERMGSVLVAFSGGVDSTLLLYAASKFLHGRTVAATIAHPFMTDKDVQRARSKAEHLKVPLALMEMDLFSRPEITANPPQRCYHCKLALFGRLKEEAARRDLRQVIDATQVDDLGEFRPGLIALAELGVASPLAEAGFTKEDVRKYSRIFGLQGTEEPASPCLATRIPFRTPITRVALLRVAAAEEILTDVGFPMVRVRDHFPVAVIEVPEEDVERLSAWPVRKTLIRRLKDLEYSYVALDLQGYRSGSMAEAVLERVRRKPLL